jgi:hemerythrin-like domain-containing protein
MSDPMTLAHESTPKAPNLLNDDGTASIATALMMSHHGFRRDLVRFGVALLAVQRGDSSRVEALREEWKTFRATLHGHHESEDHGVFPNIAAQHETARATIEGLSADHRRIDPLLERGDAAFAELPRADEAQEIVRQLTQLLDRHLAIEEAELVPFLRELKTFPPPPNDEAAAMYAQGFAWAMQGIAPDVLDRLYAMLPENLTSRLPAACIEFDQRCQRVWGATRAGCARTPIPEPLSPV